MACFLPNGSAPPIGGLRAQGKGTMAGMPCKIAAHKAARRTATEVPEGAAKQAPLMCFSMRMIKN
jgi:hypothetical protein